MRFRTTRHNWLPPDIRLLSYLINSDDWANGAALRAGAVTQGSTTTGVSGVVSAANSIVGGRTDDHVFGMAYLPNGNYIVGSPTWDNGLIADAGAVSLVNGASGRVGLLSASNSLVGSTAGDSVGSGGFTFLSTGNLVVTSYNWDNGAAVDAGAVTFMNGASGLVGTVSASNSLVGGTSGDQVGFDRMWVLPDGDYVVTSTRWDSGPIVDVGAVTWGSGTSGVTGLVSATNSLIGSTAYDAIGSAFILVLPNGAYVVGSPSWSNGPASRAGAATWAAGDGSTVGVVTAANSLVGSQTGDQVGQSMQVLANGNYVVSSQSWDHGPIRNTGAITWGNGLGGTTGPVSTANSLVGAGEDDYFAGVAPLTNGNYVFYNGGLDDGPVVDVGVAGWASGTGPTTGVLNISMGLHGSVANDGGSIDAIPLANGNYVVRTPFWDNGAMSNVGAVTWGNGLGGTTGAISPANSLVGSSADDLVGIGDFNALPNGHYFVSSPLWNNGAATAAGAITWGNGNGGTVGEVTPLNSLVGTHADDYIGYFPILMEGGYVVNVSPEWDSGSASDVGAVTWLGNMGTVVGPVSAANSLVGSHPFDNVGDFSVDNVLSVPGGNYIVSSQDWNGVGAVTFGRGDVGVSGVVSSLNSILGTAAGDRIKHWWDPSQPDSSVFLVTGNEGRVKVGLTDLNQLSYNRATGQTVTLLPGHLTAQLATGSSLVLQASNDITINSPVIVPGASGGDLTLQAGRSLLINAGIATAGGDINLYANTLLSSGVVDADRDPGAAVITMAAGTSLDAGTGDIRIHLGPGTGMTHLTSGAITLGSLSGGGIRVDNAGSTSGSDIILRPGATLSATGAGDAIRLAANGNFINNAGATSLSAPAGRWLVYSQLTGSAGLAPTGNVTGGLTGKAWYGAPYTFSASGFGNFASAPGTGNRFVYGFQPLLNVSVDAVSVTYTGAAPAAGSFNVTGLRAGDSAADAWSGAPALGGLAAWNVGTYAVTPTIGTLVSGLNYGFSFTPGNLTITPAPLTIQAVSDTRVYTGATLSSLAPLVTGLQGTDSVTGLGQAFDSRNAGARTVSVTGYTVNDGNGGANYTVTTLSAAGSITRAPLVLTASAASRAYDGTTTAAGTPVA
ncbi:MAG: YDG domain-containing protein, partial [Phenylobacterium sp.]